jgi:hypothetical protein
MVSRKRMKPCSFGYGCLGKLKRPLGANCVCGGRRTRRPEATCQWRSAIQLA